MRPRTCPGHGRAAGAPRFDRLGVSGRARHVRPCGPARGLLRHAAGLSRCATSVGMRAGATRPWKLRAFMPGACSPSAGASGVTSRRRLRVQAISLPFQSWCAAAAILPGRTTTSGSLARKARSWSGSRRRSPPAWRCQGGPAPSARPGRWSWSRRRRRRSVVGAAGHPCRPRLRHAGAAGRAGFIRPGTGPGRACEVRRRRLSRRPACSAAPRSVRRPCAGPRP